MNHPPFNDFVKSRFYHGFVIPAKPVPARIKQGAGIQLNQAVLGSRLRGSDGFSGLRRDHPHSLFIRKDVSSNGGCSRDFFGNSYLEGFLPPPSGEGLLGSPSEFIAEGKQVPWKNKGTCPGFSQLCKATLIPAKAVIPAKPVPARIKQGAGIQEKTGFRSLPRT